MHARHTSSIVQLVFQFEVRVVALVRVVRVARVVRVVALVCVALVALVALVARVYLVAPGRTHLERHPEEKPPAEAAFF